MNPLVFTVFRYCMNTNKNFDSYTGVYMYGIYVFRKFWMRENDDTLFKSMETNIYVTK